MFKQQRVTLAAFLTILLTLLVLLPALPPSAMGSQPLTQGDRGPLVSELQWQLKQLGYLQAPATGYFGPQTSAAVTKVQKDYYLTVDGIVGPQTQSILQQLLAGTTPVNTGAGSTNARTVLGYFTGDEGYIPSSQASLDAHGNQLTYVTPFRYRLHPSGNGQLSVHGVSDQEIKQLMTSARKQNVKVLVLVHNLLYDQGTDGRWVAHQTLSDPAKRWALVTNIYNVIRNNDFDGVEIDIENIYSYDKQLFNQFMAELSAKLRPAGYRISVALPAKLSDTPNKSWADSFEYGTVGRYADQVVIMAYDEHGYSSGPGAIASKQWVENVVRYTLTKIQANKVLLGLPAYGFDWNYDRPAPRYLSHDLAMQTARQYGSSINWNDAAQVPYFTYTDENGSWHQVWFENSSSWAAKLDLVNKYNLQGIAIWRLGMEDSKGWQVIADKFKAKKM